MAEDTTAAAPPRAKISRGGLGCASGSMVVDHLTVDGAAAGLGVCWHAANSATIPGGRRRLIYDTGRLEGVTMIGVDERVWRPTEFGDKYITVMTDLPAAP